jgi:hypothetical protein
MSSASARQPLLGVVIVERYLHAATSTELADLARATRAAVRAVTREGGVIVYLGSVLIPDDETCFCVFQADSVATVAGVNARVDAPCVQVSRGIAIDALRDEREVPD